MISNLEKYANIAECMGENIEGLSTGEAAFKAIEAIKNLSKDVNTPGNLQAFGTNFELMAKLALEDGNTGSDPILGTEKDSIQLFEAAY